MSTDELLQICHRLKKAKCALEIDGECPETTMDHENDPYNIGFIYASISNSLHNATDSLKTILVCKEPGNIKEIFENSEILNTDGQTDDIHRS